jgi:hypothetical protein
MKQNLSLTKSINLTFHVQGKIHLSIRNIFSHEAKGPVNYKVIYKNKDLRNIWEAIHMAQNRYRIG